MMEMEFKKENDNNNTPLPEKEPAAELPDAEVKNGSTPPVPEKEVGSQKGVTMIMSELESKTKEELVEMAKEIGIASPNNLKKHDIIMRLLESHTEQQGNIFCSGILEIMADGYGFLRQQTLLPGQTDVYISPSQIRRFSLRNGDMVTGQGRPPKSNEKYFSLLQVVAINNLNSESAKGRQPFGSLTPTFPDRLINHPGLKHSYQGRQRHIGYDSGNDKEPDAVYE